MVELHGQTATGIAVPQEVVVALGPGKRPAVVISIGGHSYRTTVAPMGGRFFVPLSAEHRKAAGVAAGDEVDVGIEPDTAPREVTVPADLAEALVGDTKARGFYREASPPARPTVSGRLSARPPRKPEQLRSGARSS